MTIFRQIEPQAARGKFREFMWVDLEHMAEEKYDGIRETAQFIGPLVRFAGRRESVKGGLTERSAQLPHLSGVGCPEEWKNPNVPALDGTALDGEVVLSEKAVRAVRAVDPRGALSKVVQSMLNSSPEEAVRKQVEKGWLEYVVFDILWANGKDVRDLPLEDRRRHLSDAVGAWNNPFVRMAEVATGTSKRDFYDRILARGGEGIILKHVDHRYGQQTKWIKVKGTWTADVFIVGYKAARELSVKKGDDQETMTKYAAAGLIGAVVCGQYVDDNPGVLPRVMEVATISGMDDKLRDELSHNGQSYLNRVVRILHNGREPTGRFRHPRWDDFRTDKAPTACVYDPNEK